MSSTLYDLPFRPRRNRRTAALRGLMRETELSPAHLILPLFVTEGDDTRIPISAMPGCYRLSIQHTVAVAREASSLGIPAVALFPALPDTVKDKRATESTNPDGLLQRTVKALKDALPDLAVITDVAMDPYSSDGHDGYVEDGEIVNDITLDILAGMAVAQAQAGADIVAPSDMMDGRVAAIRAGLDAAGFERTAVLSYAVKYASAFYGPFRDAAGSSPSGGDAEGHGPHHGAPAPRDRATYQMDPRNAREADLEAALDVAEGADLLLVKPALPYLDVVARVRARTSLPLVAYHVSGEYAMLEAAAAAGALDRPSAVRETLWAIRRAGADLVLTYHAIEAAEGGWTG